MTFPFSFFFLQFSYNLKIFHIIGESYYFWYMAFSLYYYKVTSLISRYLKKRSVLTNDYEVRRSCSLKIFEKLIINSALKFLVSAEHIISFKRHHKFSTYIILLKFLLYIRILMDRSVY